MGQSMTMCTTVTHPEPKQSVSKKGCFNFWLSVSDHHILPFLPKTCTLSFLPSCSKLHLKSLLLSPRFTLNCSQHWIPSCLLQSPCPLPTVNTGSTCPHCSAANEAGLEDTRETKSPEHQNGQSHGVGKQTGGGAAQSPVNSALKEGEGTKQHPAEGQVKVPELRAAPSFVFWATFAVAW